MILYSHTIRGAAGATQKLKRGSNPDPDSSSPGTATDEWASNIHEIPRDQENINLCPKALSTHDCRG